MPKLSLLLAVVVAAATGCRTARPASLADWNACIVSHARLAASIDAGVPTLAPERGDGQVLALHAEWGKSPVATEYTFGELYVGLPAELAAGAVLTPGPKQGMYREGGLGLSFNSTDVGGTLEVVAVTPDHAELVLDLAARSPDIDVEHRAPLALRAKVRARRVETSKACD